MIKQMVGDDPVKGERKYKDPITFYKKPLLLFAGNYAIQIPKVSREQALLNRMVIIPFSNPKEEHEMHRFLYKELLKEAPYIVGEAIKAFQQLMNRNFQITHSRIPEEYQTVEAREMFNAVSAFFFDCCVVAQEEEISTDSLFAAYRQYAANRGLEQTNQINFSRLFAELLRQEGVGVETVKRASGSGQRGYRGIALKTSDSPA